MNSKNKMKLVKISRTLAIVFVLLSVIWLVENWAVLPGLLDVGFRIPVKAFLYVCVGDFIHYFTSKINAETKKIKKAKAEGDANIESAKADELEKDEKTSRVKVAKARKRAKVAHALAESIK